MIPWSFLSRLEYSLTDSNPRRRIHSDIKEGLEDITREVMASINSCSRQRGRVVEERSALYGYRRVNSYGADTILDLLLVYRKYRGRKVTLPVRRHVYLHQHFTGTIDACEFVYLDMAFLIRQRNNNQTLIKKLTPFNRCSVKPREINEISILYHAERQSSGRTTIFPICGKSSEK